MNKTNLFVAILFGLLTHLPELIACSEAGPKEFEVEANTLRSCKTQAQQLTQGLATHLWKLSGQKNLELKPPYNKPSEALTEATRKNSEIILSVSFTTSSGWDCVFCVSFTTNGKSACEFKRIVKHFCSN